MLGGVGSLAAQLARWGGATVISTVWRRGDLGQVPARGQVVALDEPDPAQAIRALAPGGVNRIIEVAFSDNVDLGAAVADLTVAARDGALSVTIDALLLEQAAQAQDRVDQGARGRVLLTIPD